MRLAVNGIVPGERVPAMVRDRAVGELHRLGVEIVPYVRLFGVDGDSVYFRHVVSGEPVILDRVDTLVSHHAPRRNAGPGPGAGRPWRPPDPDRRLPQPAHRGRGGAGGHEGRHGDLIRKDPMATANRARAGPFPTRRNTSARARGRFTCSACRTVPRDGRPGRVFGRRRLHPVRRPPDPLSATNARIERRADRRCDDIRSLVACRRPTRRRRRSSPYPPRFGAGRPTRRDVRGTEPPGNREFQAGRQVARRSRGNVGSDVHGRLETLQHRLLGRAR